MAAQSIRKLLENIIALGHVQLIIAIAPNEFLALGLHQGHGGTSGAEDQKQNYSKKRVDAD